MPISITAFSSPRQNLDGSSKSSPIKAETGQNIDKASSSDAQTASFYLAHGAGTGMLSDSHLQGTKPGSVGPAVSVTKWFLLRLNRGPGPARALTRR